MPHQILRKQQQKNFDIISLAGEATDYSKETKWMYKETDAKYEVDLLYFYPTVTSNPNDLAVSKISREMKESATYAFAETASCFAPYTNVFAPFYALTSLWDPEKYPLETNVPVNGDKSYHTFDYAFFYMNLRENCKKRIESYLGKQFPKCKT